ncbi:unnamed protein product, partial [Prorocentrum cordatum]
MAGGSSLAARRRRLREVQNGMAAGRASARPPWGGLLRGAAAARAAADKLAKRLSNELEEARKECQCLQGAFASAIANGDIGDKARLDNQAASRAPPVECIVEVCYAEAPVKACSLDVKRPAAGPTVCNLAAPECVPRALANGVVWRSADEQADVLLE